MEIKNKISRILSHKILWIVFSILASFFLWVYIANVDSDVYKRTIHNVPIEFVGEDLLHSNRGLVIINQNPQHFSVDVSGPRRIVSNLDSGKLKMQVDVSGITTPTNTSMTPRVVFSSDVDTSSIQVTNTFPSTVSFSVSKEVTKNLQVRGSFDGHVASEYTAETPQFEPAGITITGPEEYLRKISYAWVTFGSGEEITSTYVVQAPVSLMDESGEVCDQTGITLSSDTVTSTLSILQTKEVPLELNLLYTSGATPENTKVTIEPESITLAGDTDIISGLNKIVLAEIDLSDFESSLSDVFVIPLTGNLRNLSGVSEAKVTIEINDLVTKSFKVSNLSCINITDGFSANIVSNEIEVMLRGTAEDIEAVKSSNIRAVADLTDYNQSAGTFMPVVKIYVDGFTNVGAVGEHYITINLK